MRIDLARCLGSVASVLRDPFSLGLRGANPVSDVVSARLKPGGILST